MGQARAEIVCHVIAQLGWCGAYTPAHHLLRLAAFFSSGLSEISAIFLSLVPYPTLFIVMVPLSHVICCHGAAIPRYLL